MSDSTPVTIYHNPACGTSRNTLALIRNAGIEPTIVEYLKTPADRATLESLIGRMGIRPRELLRQKGSQRLLISSESSIKHMPPFFSRSSPNAP